MKLIGALTEAGIKSAKKAPFYSAVDEALAAIKRPKGTGAEFFTELSKQPGVKKAELADRKLEQAFKAKGKMTKEEAQQVLADNPPPQLKEKVYDESTAIDEADIREAVSQEMFGVPYSEIGTGGAWHRVSDEVYRRMEMDNGTKFGEYRTPGGENYREILLKLPDDKQRFWAKNGQGVERIFNDPDEASRFAGSSGDARAMDSQTVDRMRNEYHSSHWENEPNVLAHMRVQDRKGPNGEKILHVEEIQSDWHQAGRKKGYKPDDYVKQSNALDREFFNLVAKRAELKDEAQRLGYFGEGSQALTEEANSITPKLMKLQEQRDILQNVINYGVPDAPFKKNWHELAMKRLLNYAADNGYDSIAITPGAEQAKRFDLSKQISRVVYSPDTEMLNAFDHNNKSVVMHANVKPDQVADYIGKEPAQRLFDEQNTKLNFKGGKDVPYQEIAGVDLQVGGEGMKGFYDKILPDYLNTFGKPYGAQVNTLNMTSSRGAPQIEEIQRMAGINQDQWRAMTGDERVRLSQEMQAKANAGGMPLHNFPITPEMRESIKQKGLPLYQQVGIPTAGAGAASQSLQPEEETGLATGGVVKSAVKQAHLAKLAKMRQEMTPRAEAIKALIAKDQNSYLRDVVPNSLTNPEIEAEISRMAARAKASGQQEGVLPRAERDANLAKMLEESAAKKRLYHATDKDVVSYDKSKLGTNPDTAHQTSQLGFFLTDSIDEATGYAGKRKGANIQPVYANIKNPYVTTWDNIHEVDGSELQQKLKGLGYDGVLIKDKGMPDNYVAFEPTQIKSAIGNRGTYDVNEPDITKAKGGKVRMTTNRDTMFMELSNKKLKRK